MLFRSRYGAAERYTPTGAFNSNQLYSKRCAHPSASTRVERRYTDSNSMDSVSALIICSSQCCVEQFNVAPTIGSHYSQEYSKRTDRHCLKPLALQSTASNLGARTGYLSTSVRHSRNRHATSELFQTISLRTLNVPIAWPVKCPAFNIVAQKPVIMSTSSKSFTRPALIFLLCSMDVISTLHLTSCHQIPAFVKLSKSKNQRSRFAK